MLLTPRLRAALDDAGAVFVRRSKHLIFRLPNGRNFVVAVTPSDHRAERQQLTQLRRLVRETNQPPHAEKVYG